jgi:hypothetical protein
LILSRIKSGIRFTSAAADTIKYLLLKELCYKIIRFPEKLTQYAPSGIPGNEAPERSLLLLVPADNADHAKRTLLYSFVSTLIHADGAASCTNLNNRVSDEY